LDCSREADVGELFGLRGWEGFGLGGLVAALGWGGARRADLGVLLVGGDGDGIVNLVTFSRLAAHTSEREYDGVAMTD